MKIAVIGLGYVGLSNALLLAQKYPVWAVDVNADRMSQLQCRQSPFIDPEIASYLARDDLNLCLTSDKSSAIAQADFVIVATPTNYDDRTNCFDTSTVDSVIADVVAINPFATIVVKSTIPVGYTAQARERFDYPDIVFSPEFLREGKALYDNLYPSRIVVGAKTEKAAQFAQMLKSCALSDQVAILLTESTEAEAIKLFANTYLAMRVAFFNELDTYAMSQGLDAKEIIAGVSLDSRIGQHYNNPSLGYGGYCLPKDTKQLLANYEAVPNNIIRAVVESNETRKSYIADLLRQNISDKACGVVGIYRLAMKKGSDNFRSSAIIDIMQKLIHAGVNVVVYEPAVSDTVFLGAKVEVSLDSFKAISDIVVANRQDSALDDIADKVFTRDLFGNDL